VTVLDGLADQYNVRQYFRELNTQARQAYRNAGLRAGTEAPGFTLPTVDGETLTCPDPANGHTVVVFGCYSAGPCVAEMPRVQRVADEYAAVARTVFVYTREGHPGETLRQGTFARHESIEQKTEIARRFRDDLELSLPVGVDDLAGSVHRAYGQLAFNCAIVRTDGVLVHRQEWTSAEQLAAALENLRVWDERQAAAVVPRISYSESVWCMERLVKKP
jgi:thiol-disulfide isomerase/thioredoxin